MFNENLNWKSSITIITLDIDNITEEKLSRVERDIEIIFVHITELGQTIFQAGNY